MFLAGESVLIRPEVGPSLSDSDILAKFRPAINAIKSRRPDFPDIPEARIIANYREHDDASGEILVDYPRKLKKWTLVILSDYAHALASKIFFAALRLDELNACTMKLPSGAIAIAVNHPLLGITPALYTAAPIAKKLRPSF